ncbi:MAG: hypothetical protein PWQ22_1228 [Archaeoglobaceae archaeon]|nr:hypothetical protein [Archaeoglobaceae archaeon]
MSVLDLVDEEDKERAKKILERVIAGESVLDEIRYRTKDGKVRWVFGLYRPFFYENKPYAVGNYIDITRAKRLEEKIKELREQGILKKSYSEWMTPSRLYIPKTGIRFTITI